MALKTGFSKIFAKKNERAYMYVKSKDKKTTADLNTQLRLKLFETGKKQLKFEKTCTSEIATITNIQVPEKGLENIRIRLLKNIGKITNEYLICFLKYPHQILRIHSIATGAKADRISKGMSLAFGKPIGKAIRLKKGQSLIKVYYKNNENIPAINKVLKKVVCGLPFRAKIINNKSFTPKN